MPRKAYNPEICWTIISEQPHLTWHEGTYPFIIKVTACSPECLRDERNDLVNRLDRNGRDTFFRLVEYFKKCQEDVALNSDARISLETIGLEMGVEFECVAQSRDLSRDSEMRKGGDNFCAVVCVCE